MTTRAERLPPGITVIDLWERDGRTTGHRHWFRVRSKGLAKSRAFPSDNWSAGLAWAQRTLGEFLTTTPEIYAEKQQAMSQRASLRQRARLSYVVEAYLSDPEHRDACDVHRNEIRRVVGGAIAAGLDDLTQPDLSRGLESWLTALKSANPACPDREIHHRTRNRFLGHFKTLGRYAIDKLEIPGLVRNPFAAASRYKAAMREAPIFSVDECRRLVSDTTRASDPAWLLFAIALYTGLRISACMWLRWEHVMWDAKRIRITPPTAAEREGGKGIKRDSGWTAGVQPELLEILQVEAKERFGEVWANATGYIMSDDIRSWNAKQWKRAFARVAKAAKVPIVGRRVNDLRHTNASLMAATGADPAIIKSRLGHAKQSTVTDHYKAGADELSEAARGWPLGEFYLRRQLPTAAPAPKSRKVAGK